MSESTRGRAAAVASPGRNRGRAGTVDRFRRAAESVLEHCPPGTDDAALVVRRSSGGRIEVSIVYEGEGGRPGVIPVVY